MIVIKKKEIDFFRKFVVYNWFQPKIILMFEKYLFSGYSKWQQIKHNDPGLNRGLSLKFWWLRSVKHVKFTKESVHRKTIS